MATGWRNWASEVRNVDGRLHIARKERFHDEWDRVPAYDPYGPGKTVSDDRFPDA